MTDTLHINLYRKWFDMTLAGIKTEDYRELTPYWGKRLTKLINFQYVDGLEWTWKNTNSRILVHDYKTTIISNGYAKDRDQFEVEFKGVDIGKGNPDWGAPLDRSVFIIKHGDIVQANNDLLKQNINKK